MCAPSSIQSYKQMSSCESDENDIDKSYYRAATLFTDKVQCSPCIPSYFFPLS